MEKHNLFSIGDVAKMFHLSVGSLRHYEAIGILTPEYIDSKTNYRYYSVRQFEVLNTICYLRVLDMPLPQIADFLKNRDIAVIEKMLQQQKEAVAKKQLELAVIERKIDNRLRQLDDALSSELNVIRIETAPSCRLVWIEDSLKIKDFLDMEAPIRRLGENEDEAVIFLGKVGIGISEKNLCAKHFERYDCIFLVLDEEDRYNGKYEIMPETLCVSVRFCGSHKEAPAQYERLTKYISEHKLQIAGFSREITMIDYGITDDPEKFVTEIRVPVTCRD